MREAIGSETIFKAVILFTLIFAAFITVAITYNKAYKMKNEAMFILEKYEGVNDQSVSIINNFLSHNGYNTMGVCESDEVGVPSLDDSATKSGNGKDKYYYCMKTTSKGGKSFITIKVFFKFGLPIFGDLMTFQVTGETKGLREN